MTQASATRAGRLAALRNMRDACTVHSLSGDPDPLTGESAPVVVYTGPCKVQTFEPYESNRESGGAMATIQRYGVHLPVGSFRPEVGMVVTIAATELDPYLAGRQFRVVALLHKTAATAYRLGVEEVS